eukprot:6182406-Pleurochrysis_carterae.AAC.6
MLFETAVLAGTGEILGRSMRRFWRRTRPLPECEPWGPCYRWWDAKSANSARVAFTSRVPSAPCTTSPPRPKRSASSEGNRDALHARRKRCTLASPACLPSLPAPSQPRARTHSLIDSKLRCDSAWWWIDFNR